MAPRSALPADGVLGAVRNIIRRMPPALPVTQVRTMRQSIDLATALQREMMALGARGSDVRRAVVRNAAQLNTLPHRPFRTHQSQTRLSTRGAGAPGGVGGSDGGSSSGMNYFMSWRI